MDSSYDSTTNLDKSSMNPLTPVIRLRTTRKLSTSNTEMTTKSKRSTDDDDQLQSLRKQFKSTSQSTESDFKVECQNHFIISPSAAIAATRPLTKVSFYIC